MNLILQGRGVTLDDRLRSYADEKFSKIERIFDHIEQIDVELRRERNPRVDNASRVDVVLRTDRETLRSHGEGNDHFAAIDAAAHRLEGQIRRIKDRLTDHHHRHKDAVPNGQIEAPVVQPGAIVELRQQGAKPMSPEDARLELESRGTEFLLFTDADTMRAAVLFRRDDGTFGLIPHEG